MSFEITQEWLDDWDEEGKRWFWSQKERDHRKCVLKLIREKKLDWANWAIVRGMTRSQYLRYDIYAAEQVIGIFEEKYPGDERPRKTIEAVKAVLKEDSKYNRDAAGAAAWDAARAALLKKILRFGLRIMLEDEKKGGAEMTIPWEERVPMLSINPDAATREDIARMAAEIMDLRYAIDRAIDAIESLGPEQNGHIAAKHILEGVQR